MTFRAKVFTNKIFEKIEKSKIFFKKSQILPTGDDNFLLGQFLRGQGAQKYIGSCSTILFGLKLLAPNSDGLQV